MPPINLEKATIQMYENASLTEELTDSPATTLLKWGEKQLSRLSQVHEDEETFEADYKALRRLMKSMSKFTSTRHTMTEEESHDYILNRIVSKAQEIGLACTESGIDPFLDKQRNMDDDESVGALIEFVENSPADSSINPDPGKVLPSVD